MHNYISGIQQIGIGVTDAHEGMQEYKKVFGMDTLIFDDEAEAKLMTQYTGGDIHNRRAALTMNLSGGGGFEIWQFISRQPQTPEKLPVLGDFGINAAKIKCKDVAAAHRHLKAYNSLEVSDILINPEGEPHFWVTDSNNNLFHLTQGLHWFQSTDKYTGGVSGAVIGVSDMNEALTLYRDVLGISELVYDKTETFEDLTGQSNNKFRRVLLRKPYSGKGGFGKLLGSIEIELLESLDRQPKKIYENRYWGDCGFIHICFDVLNMNALKELAKEKGYSFSVDSENSFDMESAAGRFCYIETKDGTLIELVETHKVPVLKKLGLYINLKKRNLEKPLPDWMIKMLALSKVK